MNSVWINLLKKIPYFNKLYQTYILGLTLKQNSCYPPGHYYSAVPSLEAIKQRENIIWEQDLNKNISGIVLDPESQVKCISDLSVYYKDLPYGTLKKENRRYDFDNSFYSYTDGIILYSLIRHIRPNEIIEIGSGFSSALMLDINEIFFENKINLTFIEPNAERLFSLFTEKDKQTVKVINSEVQLIDKSIFKTLEQGDILFIDSSHVAKTGSDLNFILFEILPEIKRGVYIHFHDIFYPFEYPKEWIYAGRNWNEDYFLKAFLMYNTTFEIIIFSDYIHKYYAEAFSKMPLTYKNTGGSLWLRKK
jgi:hypothetical protein